MNRQEARRIVLEFEDYVREDEVAGAGHPDLVDWHAERAEIARERMIRKLCGDPRRTPNMPPQPEVEY